MSMKVAPALRTNSFFQIEINHLPTAGGTTNKPILFEGWVTEFSDQFSSNWNAETVYGRMDPLATFQNTQRSISLGFDIVSDNIDQAQQNLAKVNRFIEFLYPVYDNTPDLLTDASQRGQQNVLKAGPLLSMRWTNLVASALNNAPLVGYINGLNYAPDVSQGGFYLHEQRSTGIGAIEEVPNPAPYDADGNTTYEYERKRITRRTYIPKVLSLSFEFTVMHTHLGGWYLKDGSYYFGSEEINGAFPNAGGVETVRDEKVQVTKDSEGEVLNQAVISGSAAQHLQGQMLGGY
tara:strand:+ start:400 stop:1275 length:876 start_codon:yes stop_codon:yes gene_type:complete